MDVAFAGLYKCLIVWSTTSFITELKKKLNLVYNNIGTKKKESFTEST